MQPRIIYRALNPLPTVKYIIVAMMLITAVLPMTSGQARSTDACAAAFEDTSRFGDEHPGSEYEEARLHAIAALLAGPCAQEWSSPPMSTQETLLDTTSVTCNGGSSIDGEIGFKLWFPAVTDNPITYSLPITSAHATAVGVEEFDNWEIDSSLVGALSFVGDGNSDVASAVFFIAGIPIPLRDAGVDGDCGTLSADLCWGDFCLTAGTRYLCQGAGDGEVVGDLGLTFRGWTEFWTPVPCDDVDLGVVGLPPIAS